MWQQAAWEWVEKKGDEKVYVSCRESPFKEQMQLPVSPSSYRNHLALFIAIYCTWSPSHPLLIWLCCNQKTIFRKVLRRKLQVTLQQRWRQSLQSSTDFAPKKLKVFSANIWFDAYSTSTEVEILNAAFLLMDQPGSLLDTTDASYVSST